MANAYSYIKAAKRGDMPTLKQCLAEGVPVDTADQDGNTALIWAVSRRQNNLTKFLLESGANPDKTNNLGETALMWACYYGQKESVGYLLDAGADSNKRSRLGWDVRRFVYESSVSYSDTLALVDLAERRKRNIWKKTGPSEVRHDTCLSEGKIELTEIFDFVQKERLSIVKLEDGKVSHSRERFSSVPRALLNEAAAMLNGDAPPRKKGPIINPRPF